MYYIYGSKKDRERFIKSGTFPFFEHEEHLDSNCTRYYNDSEDDGRSAWLVIDLDEQTYTVLDVSEDGETLSESEFESYSEAIDAYNELVEAIEAQAVKTYEVWKDNGSGIYLFELDANGECTYAHRYENVDGVPNGLGELRAAIEDTKSCDCSGWDGNDLAEYPSMFIEIANDEQSTEVTDEWGI